MSLCIYIRMTMGLFCTFLYVLLLLYTQCNNKYLYLPIDVLSFMWSCVPLIVCVHVCVLMSLHGGSLQMCMSIHVSLCFIWVHPYIRTLLSVSVSSCVRSHRGAHVYRLECICVSCVFLRVIKIIWSLESYLKLNDKIHELII